MQPPPISQTEIDARIRDHVDELLELWWAEQGISKIRDLDLIASAIPFPHGDALRVLDLCCGPGDVGRAIRQVYPMAHIDSIDRDPFLTSICRIVNGREALPGMLLVRDLNDEGWLDSLQGNYDVVAMVNALHWFDARRASQLVDDVNGSLRSGGVFLLIVCAATEQKRSGRKTRDVRDCRLQLVHPAGHDIAVATHHRVIALTRHVRRLVFLRLTDLGSCCTA